MLGQCFCFPFDDNGRRWLAWRLTFGCFARSGRGLLYLLQSLQPAGRMHGAALNVRFDERYEIWSRQIRRQIRRPIAKVLQDPSAALVAHADVVGNGERVVYAR